MCGIAGIHFSNQSNLITHEVDYFRLLFTDMLVNAQARGRAATGVVVVNYDVKEKRSRINMFKAPLMAEKFVETDLYKKILKTLSPSTMYILGHTRAATSGSAYDNANNHPHVYGRFVGVHNGMIQDEPLWKNLAPEMRPRSQCDSEAFFAFMDKHVNKGDTVEQAARKFAAVVEGWYALAFFDKKDAAKLYIAKDSSTPLSGYYSLISDSYAFASESLHVSDALDSAAKKYGTDTVPKVKSLVSGFRESPRTLPTSAVSCLDYFWDRKRATSPVYSASALLTSETEQQRRFREQNEEAYKTTQGISSEIDERFYH